MTCLTAFGRCETRIGKINGSVKRPFDACHLFSFHEVGGRQYVVGIVHEFLRKNILNHTEFELLKLFGQFLRIGFTMEHGCSDKENAFDRVRFAGYSSLQCNFESCRCFGINDLIDAFFLSHLPFFSVGTFSCRNARNAEARTGCDN